MFESLFGAEMPLPVRFFIAFLIVLGLIGVTAWIVRRFGADRLGAATARGRQPRLAVIDAAPVDGRRRLILIRRDNVEHLLMIGGPTDVVVEANIVRAAAASREVPAPTRTSAPNEPLPRAAPLGDAGMWPLQPEPAPMPRPQRAPAPEESMQWPVEPELPAPPPAPRRQPRPVDPLAGLAAELSRAPELARGPTPPDGNSGAYAPREPARQPREPARQRAAAREPIREPEPQPEPEPVRQPVREREPARMREPPAPASITDPEFNSNADQNLAEMAQRLEAALRRPARANDARPAESAARASAPEPEPEPANAQPQPAPPPLRAAAAEAIAPRPEPKPAKSLYDSLEKEMANLLGRPGGKS